MPTSATCAVGDGKPSRSSRPSTSVGPSSPAARQHEAESYRDDVTAAPSMLEFLRWVAARPRTYSETMEAWQTSCPRNSVWEDAQIDGLVRRSGVAVELT